MSREAAPSAGTGKAAGTGRLGRWLTRWWIRAPDGRVYQRRWADVLVPAAGLGLVIMCGVLVANQLVAGTDVALPLLAAAAALLRRFRLAAALAAAALLKIWLESVAKMLVQRGRPAETVPDVLLRGNSAASRKDCPSTACCGSRSRGRALPRVPG